MPRLARIPTSSMTSAWLSGKKYMSLKQVVPERSISAAAWRVPSATNSGLTCLPSAGKILVVSHSISGRSSARPRSIVMGEWVWVLTSPLPMEAPSVSPPSPSLPHSPSQQEKSGVRARLGCSRCSPGWRTGPGRG